MDRRPQRTRRGFRLHRPLRSPPDAKACSLPSTAPAAKSACAIALRFDIGLGAAWILVGLALAGCADKAAQDGVSVGDKANAAGGVVALADAAMVSDAGEGGIPEANGSTGGSSFRDGIDVFPELSGGAMPDEPVDAGGLVDAALTDPSEAAACFFGGSELRPSAVGQGTCASPVALDLSGAPLGSVHHVLLPSTVLDLDLPAQGKCGLEAARDTAFAVLMPDGTDLEAVVDAASDADPTLIAFESSSNSCPSGQPIACVDDGAAGECEYLRIRAAEHTQGFPILLVVSERIASGKTLTLRLRVQDPRTGT